MAQQLGSGTHGLGMGSISFDWSVIASYLGSPLATPFWAAVNIFAGFVFFAWVIVPVAYNLNWFDAKMFPIYSSGLFDVFGKKYDIKKATAQSGTTLNENGYDNYSPLRITFMFALNYGLAFAIITAAIVHVFLYHSPEINRVFSRQSGLFHKDIHNKLMQKYKRVPDWWFMVLFITSVVLGFLVCEQTVIDLPWWGFLVAIAIPAVVLIPFGIVAAVANVSLGVNVISEFVAGLAFPGRPIANVVFKSYSTTSLHQAIYLITDLKLGHYLKIPPVDMFIAQVSGSLISILVSLTTTKHLFATIPNICGEDSYPWTCPGTNIFYSASVIWGLIGPKRMFGPSSIYNILLWGFVMGAVLPFIPWVLSKKFKNSTILRHINIPVFLTACSILPPAYASEFPTWFIVAFVFNFVIYRYYRTWWLRYNYIFSASLMTGTAISTVFLFYAFQINGWELNWWGNDKDFHCPLASKPLITL